MCTDRARMDVPHWIWLWLLVASRLSMPFEKLVPLITTEDRDHRRTIIAPTKLLLLLMANIEIESGGSRTNRGRRLTVDLSSDIALRFG